jgi:hypothetical protein
MGLDYYKVIMPNLSIKGRTDKVLYLDKRQKQKG